MRLGTLKINTILHFAGGIIECHLKMAWLQMKREINWSLNIIRGGGVACQILKVVMSQFLKVEILFLLHLHCCCYKVVKMTDIFKHFYLNLVLLFCIL